MFASHSYAARAYAKVGVQSGVESSSPHGLILMLFDGALASIAQAREAMRRERIAERGEAASRAIEIVQMGLKASLDMSQGGELAQSLADLYDYIARLLLAGNATANPAKLDEAARLLGELRGAWARIEVATHSGAQP